MFLKLFIIKKLFMKNILLILGLLVSLFNFSQTTLLSPTGAGGFELGTTLTSNGWTAVQGTLTSRIWQCGTGQAGYTGARAAFIGNSSTTVGTTTNARTVHIYRSITIPAGATNISLTFKYKQALADNTYDYLRVTLLSAPPVSGTLPTSDIITTIDPTVGITTYTTQNVTIPNSYAGTTRNLVFTWRSDGVSPHAYGGLDDIGITYTPGSSCSGTPTPGNTITSSATIAAPSGTVNLSLQNATSGAGVTYQWQLSTTSSTTGFSNILGATSSTYTPTVIENTWFRCLVTCSGNVGTSNATQITLTYCIPTATSDDNTGLTFVGFNTISNTTTGASAYSDFTSQSTSVDQGGSYNLTTRVNTDGAFTANVKAWIDWNQNYVFEAGEEYSLGSANNTSDGLTTLSPLVVSISPSQSAGNYRMRIRATYNVLPTSCGNQNFSETEDYTIIVVVPPPCTGTPAPGNTISSSLTTTPNGTVNLSLQNTTNGTGVTYVWESSSDNSTWTTFGSSSSIQTSPLITSATWFRSIVTCSGNSGISSPIQITLSYCTYNITNNDPTGITSVTFGTISNTSIGNPAYSDFTTQSTTIEQDGIYQLNVSVNTDGNWTVNTKAWIDWNQNYIFEVEEEYSLGSALNTTNGITSLSPLNITVPTVSTLGETRMRIVSVESSDPSPLSCGTQLYGEAEDYKLIIIPPTGLPVELLYFEGTQYSTFNILKWSTASEQNSSHFDLESSNDGTNWKIITTNSASGNSNEELHYSYIDYNLNELTYYRLQQFDIDGKFETYGPIIITRTITDKKIIGYINLLGQNIDPKYMTGVIIEIYEDGTMKKIIK